MSKLKNTWSLLSITFIDRLALYLFHGIFISYLISENGFSNKEAATTNFIFQILLYSLPMIMGLISDLVDRQKVFKIGLILSIIGYAIIPFLSFSYLTLIVAIIILVSGVSIVRPIIPVLIGENASQSGNEKRLFRDFLLMLFFVSLAQIISSLKNSFSSTDLSPIFLVSSVLMLIAFLVNHFWAPKIDSPKQTDRQNLKQNIFYFSALILISCSVMFLTYNVRPLLTIETEGFKLTYQSVNKFFSITLSLVVLALITIKSIKIRNNNILIILGITAISFASIFLIINFQEISKFSFAPDNIILVIALIAVLEVIFFSIITMLIYKYSIRFKGFAFGLYYSSVALILLLLFTNIDINRIYLLIPIVILLVLGIIIMLMRKKIKELLLTKLV